MKNLKLWRWLALLAFFLFLCVFPQLFPDPTFMSIAVPVLIAAVSAVGWNLFAGYTGYFALGYGTFYGFGAYTLAMICQNWPNNTFLPLLIFPLAGLVAALFAIPIGWVSLRTRREIFVIVTFATLFVFQLLASNLDTVTAGTKGLYIPIAPGTAYTVDIPFYYVALLLLVLAVGVAAWMRYSKYGLGLLAIRDDEDRALGLGVKAGTFKLVAFVISAFFGGVVGAFMTFYTGYIDPAAAFTPIFSIAPPLLAMIGGIGTISGPVFGAFLIEPFNQYVLQLPNASKFNLVIYGVMLLLVLLFVPEGLIPGGQRLWKSWKVRREQKLQGTQEAEPAEPQLVENRKG